MLNEAKIALVQQKPIFINWLFNLSTLDSNTLYMFYCEKVVLKLKDIVQRKLTFCYKFKKLFHRSFSLLYKNWADKNKTFINKSWKFLFWLIQYKQCYFKKKKLADRKSKAKYLPVILMQENQELKGTYVGVTSNLYLFYQIEKKIALK